MKNLLNGLGRRSMAMFLTLVMALSMAFGAFAAADEEQVQDLSAPVQEALGSVVDGMASIAGMIPDALKEIAAEIGAADLSQLNELTLDDIPTALPEVKLPALSGGIRAELPDAGAQLVAALVGMDVSWFKNAELDWAMKDTTVNAALSLNENSLVTALLTYVAESQTLYAQLPELSQSFIKIALGKYIEQAAEQAADQGGAALEQIKAMLPTIQKAIAMLPDYLPEGAVVESIVSRYGHILVGMFKDVKAQPGEINAELLEAKAEATVYTCTISEEELANAFYAMFSTAKDDEELKGVVSKCVEYVNALAKELPELGISELDAEEIWTGISSQLGYLADSAQGSTTEGGNAKAGNYLQGKVYVDAMGMPAGIALVLANDGEEPMELVHLYVLTMEDGNGFELVVNSDGMEMFSLFGKGGITETGFNGNYKLNVAGMTMLECELQNVGQTADGLTGALIVKPGYGLGMLLGDGAAALLSYSLKFDWMLNSEAAILNISALDADQAELVKLSFGLAPTAEVVEAIPAEDATVYDVESEEDGQAYGSEIDVQGLLEKVIAAGVPAELINSLLGGAEE